MTEVAQQQPPTGDSHPDNTKPESNQPQGGDSHSENTKSKSNKPQSQAGAGAVSEKDEETKKVAELANKLSGVIEGSLEKLEPILKMLNEELEKAENTPKDELNEDKFVDKVQPLLEQASTILNEANGAVKGADPTGELARNAQRHAQDHKATPEEQRLAETLTKLTGDVTKTIERARKKLKNMPKAGPKLEPLLALLQDPLFQILSGVGILLNGVLTLVGNLLDTLGLGGIVRNLLGALGLEKVLKGLGLGKIFDTKK